MMAQAMTPSQTSFGMNVSEAVFSNTLTWGGIAGVTIGGNAVSDFTIDSASGVDWTVAASTAIPLPPAWAVLVLPLWVLLASGGLAQSAPPEAQMVP